MSTLSITTPRPPSAAFLRRRKFLLVLPVLVVPFLALGFYAAGGGTGPSSAPSAAGLNLQLPDPHLQESSLLDKLSFYSKADKDSVKQAEWMRSDPYFPLPPGSFADALPDEAADTAMGSTGEPSPATRPNQLAALARSSASKYPQRLPGSLYPSTQPNPEAAILQKLARLQQELEQPPAEMPRPLALPSPATPLPTTPAVERLEQLLSPAKEEPKADPEITQLSTVMDKILDIQHPERVREKLQAAADQASSTASPVLTHPATDTVPAGFYGLDLQAPLSSGNAVAAVVQEDQVLVTGAVLQLRLLQDIFIEGTCIPAGTFVFGTVQLQAERLTVDISSIRSGPSLFTVNLVLYDLDGLPGLYVPGVISRTAVQQTADNSLQLLDAGSLSPSIQAQAASTGLKGIQRLFSQKLKLSKVLVKAGYQVLLKNKL